MEEAHELNHPKESRLLPRFPMRTPIDAALGTLVLAALWLGEPLAYAMIGFAYAGAALGRVLSLLFDAPPLRKLLTFGGIEAALAAWLLLANLG